MTNEILLSEEDKEILYEYGRIYSSLYEIFNIKLFAIGGTLLGAHRDKDVIPWDDDIDYMILEEDQHSLSNIDLIKYLNSQNYLLFLEEHASYGRVYHINKINRTCGQNEIIKINPKENTDILRGTHKLYKVKNNLCTDIFLYGKKNENTYGLLNKYNQTVSKKDLENLTKYDFGKTKIYSFSNCEEYLKNTYGNDYMIPKNRNRNHRQGKIK